MSRVVARGVPRLATYVPPSAITIFAGLFVVLLAYAIFIAYPGISEPGPQAWQRALGAAGLRWVEIAVGLLVVGAYVLAAVVSQSRRDVTVSRCMAVGVALGTAAALVAGAALVDSARVAPQASDFGNPALILILLLVLAPPVAGSLGVVSCRSMSVPHDLDREEMTGTLAGFWCGMAFCIVVASITLARGLVFADHLAQTVWASEPTANLAGRDLIGYELGDEIGDVAFLLMLGPILGLSGAVGGIVISAIFPGRATGGRIIRSRRAERVPAWFIGAMVGLTIVRLAMLLF